MPHAIQSSSIWEQNIQIQQVIYKKAVCTELMSMYFIHIGRSSLKVCRKYITANTGSHDIPSLACDNTYWRYTLGPNTYEEGILDEWRWNIFSQLKIKIHFLASDSVSLLFTTAHIRSKERCEEELIRFIAAVVFLSWHLVVLVGPKRPARSRYNEGW